MSKKRPRSLGMGTAIVETSSSPSAKKNPPATNDDAITIIDAAHITADHGHRYGNFHQYYKFHPVHERLSVITRPGGVLDAIATQWPVRHMGGDDGGVLRYLDIGCNEGDLTMAVAAQLKQRLSNTSVHVTGVDLDNVLVERARRKSIEGRRTITQSDAKSSLSDADAATFVTANVLHDDYEPPCVHVTSVFSTTMWLHIHGGDAGLQQVLRKLCAHTSHYMMLELQPSKCYRAAMQRLRRQRRPELDVSSTRLRWRQNIAAAVDRVLHEGGFVPVDKLASTDAPQQISSSSSTGVGMPSTSWNRAILLYRREAS